MTVGFSAVLAGAALLLAVGGGWTDTGVRGPVMALVAALFVVAEGAAIHIPGRRESHTISLVEMPLVLGLVFLAPLELVVARLLGSATALVLIRRQRSLLKIGFNVSAFALETAVAASTFTAIVGAAAPSDPRLWLAVSCALAGFQVVGSAAVTIVIWINDVRPDATSLLRNFLVGSVGTAVAGAWGVVTVTILHSAPLATIPLAILAVGLYWLLGLFGRLRSRHEDLKVVHSFTLALDAAAVADELPGLFLEVANTHFMTSTAMLVSAGETSSAVLIRDDDGLHSRVSPTGLAGFGSASRAGATLLDPADLSRLTEATGTPATRAAMVPIPGTTATLFLANPRPGHSIGEPELELLETLSAHAGAVFERHRLFGALAREVELREYQARHDDLTGLDNRHAFLDEVEAILRTPVPDSSLAVFLLDIDDFKAINDTLSHRAGDHLLVDVANRLRDVLRSADIVARVGGDEFAAAVRVGSEIDAIAIAQRIHDGLRTPFVSGGLRIEVRVSVGISIGAPSGITALRQADIAMYAAKSAAGNIEIYSEEIDTYDSSNLRLAGELRPAIEAGNLHVFYQPKVRTADGAIVGFEALARWIHPERGIVSPADFIPIAERTGLMVPLTEHVLETALLDAAGWRSRGWSVSVNFSPSTIVPATATLIDDLLERTGTPPDALIVEVTESGILAERHGAAETIGRIADLGTRISIDDFGTGYSSMTRLRSLPISELKIDRSFISRFEADPSSRAIVEATATLAKRLGLVTVAEGVEEATTIEELRRLGVDEIQGYYYSPPLPVDELWEWIERHEARNGLRSVG